jgi:hypothetical protein
LYYRYFVDCLLFRGGIYDCKAVFDVPAIYGYIRMIKNIAFLFKVPPIRSFVTSGKSVTPIVRNSNPSVHPHFFRVRSLCTSDMPPQKIRVEIDVPMLQVLIFPSG